MRAWDGQGGGQEACRALDEAGSRFVAGRPHQMKDELKERGGGTGFDPEERTW